MWREVAKFQTLPFPTMNTKNAIELQLQFEEFSGIQEDLSVHLFDRAEISGSPPNFEAPLLRWTESDRFYFLLKAAQV